MKTVKISDEAKAVFDAFATANGMSIVDAISLAANMLEQKAAKVKAGENLNKSDKLLKLWQAVKVHNEVEKQGSRKYVVLTSVYWLHKQIGGNRTRDIKPFIDTIERDAATHYKSLGIGSEYTMHPDVLRKGENGESIFFAELIKKAGLAALFGVN